MPSFARILLSFSSLLLLGGSLTPGQTDPALVPWSELHDSAVDLRQNLEGGLSTPAISRIVQMQLLLAGPSPTSPEGQKIAKMGDQIRQMESRPIPSDIDLSLSRFLPIADKLLQAVRDHDSNSVRSYLGGLNSDINAAREQLSHRHKANTNSADPDPDIALEIALERSLCANDTSKSVVLAKELQGVISDLVSKHEYVEQYAFGHYMINDALGRAAFLKGDYQGATDYLQKAADIPADANGRANLDSFGPNLWLAKQLVDVGKGDAVLKFLETSKERFWLKENDKADPWIAALQSGNPTNLSPNSQVCYDYFTGDER